MSTQINVTVDSGGLSDKARQLQTAARQAQLEKERTINLSAEALDERVAAQAAKGLSLDGLPLYGPGFKQPQIERRPAANRTGGLHIFLEPNQGYGLYGIRAQNRRAQTPIDFVRDQIRDSPEGFEYGEIYRAPDYRDVDIDSTLANGRGALVAQTPGAIASVYTYNGRYVMTDKTDISAVTEFTRPDLSTIVDTPPSKRVQLNGTTLSDISGKYLFKDFGEKFTFECWLRTGDKVIPDDVNIGYFIRSSCTAWFGSCSFSLVYEHTLSQIVGGGYKLTINIQGTSLLVTLGEHAKTSVINQVSWNHCAITRDGPVYSAFINGNLASTVVLPSSIFPGNMMNLAYPYGGFFMENGSFLQTSPGFVAPRPAIHGYRVTPKVLYTSSFAPQFPLTGFT
jgi:hypothetical protein